MECSGKHICCPHCPKRFARLDHMNRHLSSHGIGDDFRCPRCCKTFKRKDVRNRHLRTCPVPGPAILSDSPPKQKRTRPRTACEQCRQSKRACDGGLPSCSACFIGGRGKSCMYAFTAACSANSHSQRMDPGLLLGIGNNPRASLGDTQTGFTYQSILDAHDSTAVIDTPDDMSIAMTLEEGPSVFSDFGVAHTHTYAISVDKDPATRFEFLQQFANNAHSTLDARYDCGSLLDRIWAAHPHTSMFHQSFNRTGHDSEVANDEVPIPVASSPKDDILNLIWGFDEHEASSGISEGNYSLSLEEASWCPEARMMAAEPNLTTLEKPQDYSKGRCSARYDQDSGPHSLVKKSEEIVAKIKVSFTRQTSDNSYSGEWSSSIEEICRHFFRQRNLEKFLGIYWLAWYPHFPVIHRPTFVASEAPAGLLAALALIGASLSPDLQDREQAKFWFDAVENVVFMEPTFHNPPTQLSSIFVRRYVQSLQAGGAVYTFQQTMGSETSKRRARCQLYPYLIALMRDLDIAKARHENVLYATEDDFCWAEFIATEERIRTSTFIFVNDTGCTIFANMPARLYVRELTMEMACPDICFQAATAHECYKALQTWTSHPMWSHRMSFVTAFRRLLLAELDETTMDHLANLSTLNLWVLSAAILSKVVQIEPFPGMGPMLDPLHNAITNWKRIWNMRSSKQDCFGLPKDTYQDLDRSQLWRRAGFHQYAPEFWLLSQVVVNRYVTECQLAEAPIIRRLHGNSHEAQHIFSKCGSGTLSEISQLIENFHIHS